MTPFEKAHALHPNAKEFSLVLEAHLLYGRVICTDNLFLLARPVWSYWPHESWNDINKVDVTGDTWYCWDMAGDLSALKQIPAAWLEEKPFVAFHRQGRPVGPCASSRFLNFGKARHS